MRVGVSFAIGLDFHRYMLYLTQCKKIKNAIYASRLSTMLGGCAKVVTIKTKGKRACAVSVVMERTDHLVHYVKRVVIDFFQDMRYHTQKSHAKRCDKIIGEHITKFTRSGKEIMLGIMHFIAGLDDTKVFRQRVKNVVRQVVLMPQTKTTNIHAILMTGSFFVRSVIKSTTWQMGYILCLARNILSLVNIIARRCEQRLVQLLNEKVSVHNFTRIEFRLP